MEAEEKGGKGEKDAKEAELEKIEEAVDEEKDT